MMTPPKERIMKNKKRIFQALGALLFAGLMLLDTAAQASIQCNATPGAHSGLSCLNSGGNGATLTIRHVPAWGPNAGYVLVDMCPGENIPPTTGTVVQLPTGTVGQHPVVKGVQLPPNTPITKEPPAECVRRYCTDDVREFALRIEATPIPIGFDLFLGLSLAFKESRFEIQCETLREQGGTPQ
jgi:hypothetical protein